MRPEVQTNAESSVLPGPRNRSWAIFLVSVLGLFLELMVIRWMSTEVRIFAYLQNTVLVVCFLGLGMGCFTCRKDVRIRNTIMGLLTLVALMALPVSRRLLARITDLLSVLSDSLIWENAVSEGFWSSVYRVGLGLALTFGLLLLLWEVFVPLGRLLGRLLDDHPRTIWAYSINVAGSLVGIWLFVAMSALSLPPAAWVLAGSLLLFAFLGRGHERITNVGLLAATVLAAWVAGQDRAALEIAWSPYQKLVLSQNVDPASRWKGQYLINVNNVGYQGIVDLSARGIAANPRITPDMAGLSQYDIPFLLKKEPQRVLMVGAGSGNDVAGALRGGAGHVTAVDIDPVIIEMGRRYHPEHPYDSPRVTVVNDDARSFFATTQDKYDLIVFGLLDSHTMTSMTNARLDHYVYTRESLDRARSLLRPGGVMALTFMAHREYIADRLGRCIRDVFGQEPLSFVIPSTYSGWGGVMFVAGDQGVIQKSLAREDRLAHQIAEWQKVAPLNLPYTTRIATDDWPYIYLDKPRIPVLYGLLGALLFGLVAYGKRRLELASWFGQWQPSNWHFFFLGAGFLLLEVQNISKASVVLGNTWLVNAVIISGILLMILCANVVAARFRNLSQPAVAACLIGSCLALYFVDLSRFGFLPYFTKAVLIGLLTTLPMLFSGIIFIRSFATVEKKDAALGANLIGAIVGGLLQSVTFIVGVKALLLIVAALYAAAMLTRPRGQRFSPDRRREDQAKQPAIEENEHPSDVPQEPVPV